MTNFDVTVFGHPMHTPPKRMFVRKAGNNQDKFVTE